MKNRKNLSSQLSVVQEYIETSPRTQKEIADYFSVNRKTVCRAIDKLSLYTHLTEKKVGKNIVYRIEKVKNPDFTQLEISTLILSQEGIISTGERTIGTPFSESAKSLIEKVRSKATPVLREKLDALSKIFGSSAIPSKDFSEHFSTIELLVKAAIEQSYVQITYQNLYEEIAKKRRFAPYNVYFDPDGATLKVIGFDENRQNIIPFSIDHIKKIEILKENFTRPDDFELRKHLEKYCFNGIHGEPILVRLKVSGITSRIFAEREFHPSQKIIRTRKKEVGEKNLTIELFVAEGRGLERFILSWMPEIEVISPIKLREKIKENLTISLSNNK